MNCRLYTVLRTLYTVHFTLYICTVYSVYLYSVQSVLPLMDLPSRSRADWQPHRPGPRSRKLGSNILHSYLALTFCTHTGHSHFVLTFCTHPLQSYSAIRFCTHMLHSYVALTFCTHTRFCTHSHHSDLALILSTHTLHSDFALILNTYALHNNSALRFGIIFFTAVLHNYPSPILCKTSLYS